MILAIFEGRASRLIESHFFSAISGNDKVQNGNYRFVLQHAREDVNVLRFVDRQRLTPHYTGVGFRTPIGRHSVCERQCIYGERRYSRW